MLVCGGSRRLGQSTDTVGGGISQQASQLPLETQGISGRGKASYVGLFPSTGLGPAHRPSQLWLLPVFLLQRAKACGGAVGTPGWSTCPPPPASSPTSFTPPAGAGRAAPLTWPLPPTPPSLGHQLLKDAARSAAWCRPPPPFLATPPFPSVTPPYSQALHALHPPAHRVRHLAAAQPAAAPASIPHPSLPQPSPRVPDTNPFPFALHHPALPLLPPARPD